MIGTGGEFTGSKVMNPRRWYKTGSILTIRLTANFSGMALFFYVISN
jgi:hypothetical protein